jgi:hypothetical protein
MIKEFNIRDDEDEITDEMLGTVPPFSEARILRFEDGLTNDQFGHPADAKFDVPLMGTETVDQLLDKAWDAMELAGLDREEDGGLIDSFDLDTDTGVVTFFIDF